jgi:carbohydrate diacid regulator
MISNQVLQSTIDGIRDISHLDVCVMDADGREVVSTQAVFADAAAAIPEFAASPADSQAAGPFQFFKVFDENQLEYILVINGSSDNTLLVGRMAAYQLQGLIEAFKEHYDKDSFMKNLLLDNLLLIDIYERAKKLHIQVNCPRVVLLVESQRGRSREHDVLVALQEKLGTGSGDFVTQVDENSTVIVHHTEDERADDALAEYAENVMKYLQQAGIQNVRLAYGTIVGEIKELSHSYKEARMALDVSRIFFEDKDIIAYNQLGIGRLIYQLPIPLCRMFIREIFKEKKPDEFDEETLTTINKFFENNLNVSETSRQLFIHRNTLVYRLDKLLKSTGLDLRVFEDAITFKIALMVVKYMKYMDQENR